MRGCRIVLMPGLIRREDIDEVRSRTRIEDVVSQYVSLRPAGADSHKGLCPFHDEKTPSFHVRPSVGRWHCFGCGEGGDVVVPERTRAEIALLKGLAVTYVMLPRESEPRYYEQRTVLFDLVDALVENPRALEPHFFEAWKARDESGRLRVIVDQVASLTDQSARQWHSRLCGFLRN